MTAGKLCEYVAPPSPVNTRGRPCLISVSAEILKTLKRKNRLLRKMPQSRTFRVKGLLQVLGSLLLTPRLQTGLRRAGPLCPPGSSLLGTGASAHL